MMKSGSRKLKHGLNSSKSTLFTAVCALITILFIMLNPLIGTAQSVYAKNEPKTEADLYSDIDTYLQSCVKNAHIPSMSVTIVDKENVLFSQSYGDCENSDTPFLLGSVSKSFTAVCIMQLVEQGKIDLGANISSYLPNSTDGDKITVGQLLNHTSGLGEHQTLANYKIIHEQGVHHYANVNYSLLGEIIETVSGKSYRDTITESVLEPLQLSHTAASINESIDHGLIVGYTNYWGFHVKSTHKYPSSKNVWITVPAGYLSSSTNDLGKYLQMYLNGGNGILSQKSIDTMFYGDTVYVEDDTPYWYGYGWATVKEPLPEPVLRHAGLIETGTSCIFILPESNIAIAIATNVNDYFVTNSMMDSLGWGVVLMLLEYPPNEITSNAYVWSHIQIDLIMFVIFFVSVLSICRIPKYAKRIKRRKWITAVMFLASFYLVLPVMILLLVPVFFSTPLWVARAFVPDVFITVVVSSASLFISGFVKSVILCKQIKSSEDR